MSQTMSVSAKDIGLELRDPEYLLPAALGDLPAFTDFFDWEIAAKEDAEDVADARMTNSLYEATGLSAFVRVR